RTLEPEMRVDHRMSRVRPGHIFRADVEAAGESNAPIDGKNLLVAAEVEKRHAPGKGGMHESCDRHAGMPQLLVSAAHKISAADTVNEYAHLDVAARRFNQSIDEAATRAIRAKDITRQHDTVARCLDRLEHHRIGFIATTQDSGSVAPLGRPVGNTVPGALEVHQVIVTFGVTVR